MRIDTPGAGRPATMAELHSKSPMPGGDSDAANFCSTCVFGAACAVHDVDKLALSELHFLVEHIGPFRAGSYIFRTGEPFKAIYAVRSGVVKTVYAGGAGREHIAGFHLPGEVIGLAAIHEKRFPCDAVAVDTAYLCRFEFRTLATLTTRLPQVQAELFRLLSKDIGSATVLAGDQAADERLAAFLLGLSRRLSARGLSARVFRLPMVRRDIANHLNLAPETVSRVLRRLHDQGWIRVVGRQIELLRLDEVTRLAGAVLPGARVQG